MEPDIIEITDNKTSPNEPCPNSLITLNSQGLIGGFAFLQQSQKIKDPFHVNPD